MENLKEKEQRFKAQRNKIRNLKLGIRKGLDERNKKKD
mgnify:CR=1 FL=1|jgi:hypothetical protein